MTKNHWIAERSNNPPTGKAVVKEIYERVVDFGRYALKQEVAILDVNGKEIRVAISTKFPSANHPHTYSNVVPHSDWVREDMEVEVCYDYDGYYVKRIT